MASVAPVGPKRVASAARDAVTGHADQHRPLAGYLVLAGAFNALFVAFLLVASRRRRLLEGYGSRDLVLLGVATFKLSRLIAKDRVLSFLLAPFTRFKGMSGMERSTKRRADEAYSERLVNS